jgi:hypothetical protein
MMFACFILLRFRSSARKRILVDGFMLLVIAALTLPQTVLADGCFVFKWDKKIDISEPNQKAIILHDGEREEMLLQVKYQGPLEEFGWLIPVPALPTIVEGSMGPFYELSILTQQQSGGYPPTAGTRSVPQGRPENQVKVIELKTVGAYEVVVLSAKDADNLTQWLKAHDYSLPDGKQEIIDDYIRRGWFFVAAKIQLNKEVAFRLVPKVGQNGATIPSKTRDLLQKQLVTGELHPVLIGFDSPRCIFPLKISSVGGKASEVSIYVLSSEPLIDKSMFDKALANVRLQKEETERTTPQREEVRKTSRRNLRIQQMASLMSSLALSEADRGRAHDWSLDDLDVISKEVEPNVSVEPLEGASHLC